MSRWSRFRRWLQPFAPDPVSDAPDLVEVAEDWNPAEDPEPEQFSGDWADMPTGPAFAIGWELPIGPEKTVLHVQGMAPLELGAAGPSGLIHKFEPGRPIEFECGVFALVVGETAGKAQGIATSGEASVLWAGDTRCLPHGKPIFWDEDANAFNAEGHGIEITGWEWVAFWDIDREVAVVHIR